MLIPEIELVLGQFLGQLAGLLLVVLFLSLLHQGYHVTHTENTVSDTAGMEDIQCLHLLAGTYELYRLVDHGLDRESGTASGVAVHLGKHHSVKIQTVIERPGCLHGILAGHGIHYKQGLGRPDCLLYGGYLVHHLLIHSQTAGGIDDDQRVAFLGSIRYRILGYPYRVLDKYTNTSIWLPSTFSWSIAAGLYTSPATSITFCPLLLLQLSASFPLKVVLPEP